jgi:heptosyltransferase III
VLFFIKILNTINKILIIIQRSNGDVFFSQSLIDSLHKYFNSPNIDLLINDDTLSMAKLLTNINSIHIFSYRKKYENRIKQEKNVIGNIYRKYDLSINLTASDRSVLYSVLASKNSISAVERNSKKSWWKKKLLSKYYYFDTKRHIQLNNLEPLNLLNIKHNHIQKSPIISEEILLKIRNKLKGMGIDHFIIFHPSAQYSYKVYPKNLRNELLSKLNTLKIPIIITGSKNEIDLNIKKELPNFDNLNDFIGETSLEEYFALSELSSAYIGMDTMNMHIAAAQNKRIFAIFGSTNLSMWSPWSNFLQKATKDNKPLQTYDNVTIFQSSLPCKVCGIVGCGNNHGKNEFPHTIEPEMIFNEVQKWYLGVQIEN